MPKTLTRRVLLAACAAALAVTVVPLSGIEPAEAAPVERPVHRFYNEGTGSHFYTSSDEERDLVTSKYGSAYTYEGSAWWTLDPEVLPEFSTPLYRFYNKANGSHFYTISATEKAFIEANYPATYAYEGIAYSVFTSAVEAPLLPVYRFYNKSNGSHFYTISDTEKMFVRLHYGATYKFEGVAFYALPSNYYYWFL